MIHRTILIFIISLFISYVIFNTTTYGDTDRRRGLWRPKSSSPKYGEQAKRYRQITGRYDNGRTRKKYADILPELEKLKDRVQKVGIKIIAKINNGNDKLSITFYISPKEKVNAWAEYGCMKNLKPVNKDTYGRFKRQISREVETQIVVTKGMMDFVESDDELAFILGHEIAHHKKGHIKKKVRMTVPISVAGKVLNPFFPGADLAQSVLSPIFVNAFSRDMEREADRFGLYYIKQAGYDINAAYSFWERMIKEHSSFKIPFLSSHPSHPERLSNMEKLIGDLNR